MYVPTDIYAQFEYLDGVRLLTAKFFASRGDATTLEHFNRIFDLWGFHNLSNSLSDLAGPEKATAYSQPIVAFFTGMAGYLTGMIRE